MPDWKLLTECRTPFAPLERLPDETSNYGEGVTGGSPDLGLGLMESLVRERFGVSVLKADVTDESRRVTYGCTPSVIKPTADSGD